MTAAHERRRGRLASVDSEALSGHRAADALRARDPELTVRITVISEETHAPYDRVALSQRLHAEIDLSLHPQTEWHPDHVEVLSGVTATSIDPLAHTVETSDGRLLPFRGRVVS